MIRDFSGCMGASATRVVGGSGGDVRAMEVFKTMRNVREKGACDFFVIYFLVNLNFKFTPASGRATKTGACGWHKREMLGCGVNGQDLNCVGDLGETRLKI